jgi:alkylation response protein AidB-like acyl-CoA dehydrogenase
MSYQFTEEQLMIRSMVRDLARTEFAPKAMERDKTKEFPRDNLQMLGELGLMGMMVPPEYGGSGADTVSYVLALAEVAYACASTAVVMSVHNSIVCESIMRSGTQDQKQNYLTRLATGEIIGAFALTEPNAGSDPVRQTTKATFDGDSYVLNGLSARDHNPNRLDLINGSVGRIAPTRGGIKQHLGIELALEAGGQCRVFWGMAHR